MDNNNKRREPDKSLHNESPTRKFNMVAKPSGTSGNSKTILTKEDFDKKDAKENPKIDESISEIPKSNGIKVVTGMVNTPMNQKMAAASGNIQKWWRERLSSIPLRRAADPEEIAEAIYWLSAENSSFITGAELRMDGGVLLGPLPVFENNN